MNKLVRMAMVENKVEGLVESMKNDLANRLGQLHMETGLIGTSLASVLNNSNKGIGEITYWNDTQIAMFFVPHIAKKAIAQLDFLQGVPNGKNKYKRFKKISYVLDGKNITKVRITQEDVDGMIENIKLTNLEDDENIKNILLDLNIVYRMYQEKTIDAAKKAIEVAIGIALNTYKALSLVHYVYEFDWNTKTLKIERMQHKNKNVQLFRDVMSKIQDNAKDFLIEIVNALAKQVPQITEEEQLRICQENSINIIGKDVRSTIKTAYGAICGELAAMKEEANKIAIVDQDEADRLNKQASEIYKERMDILNKVAYTMLKDFDEEERVNILQYVAYTDKFNKFDVTSTSKMPFSILTEEALTMILNNYAEQKQAGYKIIIAKEDMIPGEFVFFENGKTAAGSYADFGKEEEYSTDIYEIAEIDGQLYAVQDIEFNTNRGENLAFAIDNPMIEAFVPGSTVTIDSNKVVYIEDIAVGKVRANNGDYFAKLSNKTGKIKNFVHIGEEESAYTHFLVELEDVKDMDVEVEDFSIPELALDNLEGLVPEIDGEALGLMDENISFEDDEIPSIEIEL